MEKKQLFRKWCRFAIILAAVMALLPPASRAAPLVQSFPSIADSGQMLGTIAVGNVDNDAALEIVVNSDNGIHVYNTNGSLVSSFSTHNGTVGRKVNAPPTLADIDGDGRSEIVFATAYEALGDYTNTNSVFAINGENGSVLWEMPITRASYTSPDSGYQTLPGKFYYDGAEHDQLPANTFFTANASAIPIYDIDNDGRQELVVNLKIRPEPQDFNPYIDEIWGFADFGTVGESWSGGNFILDAPTGDRDYIYHYLQLNEAGIALGSVDPTQGIAVFSLSDSDSIVAYHKTAPHGFYGSGNLIGQFGKNSRIQSGSYEKPLTLNAADLTGDGKAEVLYEGSNIADLLWQGSSVIYDDQGRILWREWYNFAETPEVVGWPNAAQMIPINLDGGDPEIVSWHHTNQLFYETWDGVELVSKGGHWPVSFGDEFPSPPVVGDVDGDGQEEFVVARYDPFDLNAAGGLTILAQDGSVEQTFDTPHGIKNIPNLYDVDQDGDLDIIARDLIGTILIYDTQTGDPQRVSWATEYRTASRTGALGMHLYDTQAPVVGQTTEGYERVKLEWSMTDTTGLSGFEIYRRGYNIPTFTQIASTGAASRKFQDMNVENGELYVYKIAAVYGSAKAFSAPIPATPLMENNLALNSAMELNGDNNWDKWYTGEIGWSDMTQTTSQAYQGSASMRIHLENQGENSSIKQWNQYGVLDAQYSVTPGQLYSFGAFFKTNLNQASLHYIEWGSTYDRNRHDPVNDPIPLSAWPDYFSTYVTNPAGENDWWYSNRTFTLQEGITGLAPRHRYELPSGGSVSGDVYLDNVFFRKVGTEASDAITLLPFKSTWRYFEGTPPVNWYTADFNDSAWKSGKAKFGAGSGPQDVTTPLTQYLNEYVFRATFTLNADLSEWVVYAYATPGPGGPGIKDIYINGQFIPIQDPGLSIEQGNAINYLDLSPFIGLLKSGTNVIAIRMENVYEVNDWDDIAFDVKLKGVVAEAPGLEAAKSAAPLNPASGEIVTYTIQLDNPGLALPGVLLTDTLPAELNYGGDLWASSGTCDEENGVISWNGNIPAGGAVQIKYTASVRSEVTDTQITNTALVNDGLGTIITCKATIFPNGQLLYLPLLIR